MSIAMQLLLVALLLAMIVISSLSLAMLWCKNELLATTSSCKIHWLCSLRHVVCLALAGGGMVMSSSLGVGGSRLSFSIMEVFRILKLVAEDVQF